MEQKDTKDGISANAEIASGSLIVPVIEEQLTVTKREVITDTLVLRKTTLSDEHVVSVPLVSRKFQVERVPVELAVSAPPPARVEGSTTIFSVVEERLVTQLFVVEEIHVTENETQEMNEQVVTLSREHVTVEHGSGSTHD